MADTAPKIPFWRPHELADSIGVSKTAISRAMDEGRLGYVVTSGPAPLRLIPTAEVERYKDHCRRVK